MDPVGGVSDADNAIKLNAESALERPPTDHWQRSYQ